jgi:hypothetical protein
MSVAEFQRLLWWEQRMLCEGLIEEFTDSSVSTFDEANGDDSSAGLGALGITVKEV